MSFSFDERPSDSPLVERIWQTQSAHNDTFLSRAVSQWELVIWRYHGTTHITMRGPETQASLAESAVGAVFFGITFKLGAFMPHLPVRQLVNSTIELPEAACGAFWLQSAAWELPTFENADTFVARLSRAELLVYDPLVATVLDDRPPDLSVRAVQYRFLRATGLTRGAIVQIERAKHAEALLESGVPIADVINAAGYSDQPHLTRSLKRLMGRTPAQIARRSRPD
jgi:Helix-turn-helix domain